MTEAGQSSVSRSATDAGWRLYERMDRVRRRQGEWLQVMGWGPQETSSRTVLKLPGLALKGYAGAGGDGPAVLLVPAPIKRAYIWDLGPGASVVEACRRRGLRPYLVQWEEPEPGAGLAEYGGHYLVACAEAIAAETGSRQVILVGHSLGGILAAIFAAGHPERVAGLVLVGSPVHFSFSPRDGALGPVLQSVAARRLLDELPARVPGSLLSMAGFMAAPDAFVKARWADWWRSLPDAGNLRTHMQVERWALDEQPLAGRLVREVVEELYGRDAFMAGTLRCGGQVLAPGKLVAPLLVVAEQGCAIAPPGAVLPFFAAAGSVEKRLLWYEGDVGVAIQHVGVLVGANAHAHLWPQVLDWIWAGREQKLG